MRNYRGFVVWGGGIFLVFGAFLIFVVNGWPGTPDSCVYDTPDSCFCEAFDLAAVEAGAPGVRQPVNTWFNLYALVTSLLVATFVYRDRQTFAPGQAPNLIRSHTLLPDLYIFAVLFLGLGSMWFHGSLVAWGGRFDGLSMYIFTAFLIFYSLRRMIPSPWLFWGGYVTTVAVFTALHGSLPSFILILTLVVVYLVIEVVIWVRSGQVMQGKPATIALWLGAVGAILLATFFWWASQTGNFLCDPNSLFQPHGLLWHPLAGVMAVLLYFYWREADDPV